MVLKVGLIRSNRDEGRRSSRVFVADQGADKSAKSQRGFTVKP